MNQKSLDELSKAIGVIILLAVLILVLYVLPTYGVSWLLNWFGWNPY